MNPSNRASSESDQRLSISLHQSLIRASKGESLLENRSYSLCGLITKYISSPLPCAIRSKLLEQATPKERELYKRMNPWRRGSMGPSWSFLTHSNSRLSPPRWLRSALQGSQLPRPWSQSPSGSWTSTIIHLHSMERVDPRTDLSCPCMSTHLKERSWGALRSPSMTQTRCVVLSSTPSSKGPELRAQQLSLLMCQGPGRSQNEWKKKV